MSNQRAGKVQWTTLRDGGGMQQVNFFKYAKEVLESEGHDDAAFYFEQMETWLREGKSLSSRYTLDCTRTRSIKWLQKKGPLKSAFDGLESKGVVSHTLDNISVCRWCSTKRNYHP